MHGLLEVKKTIRPFSLGIHTSHSHNSHKDTSTHGYINPSSPPPLSSTLQQNSTEKGGSATPLRLCVCSLLPGTAGKRRILHYKVDFRLQVTPSMALAHGLFVIWVALALFISNSSNVEGRVHFHKKKNKGPEQGSPVSPSPAISPTNPPEPNDPGSPTSEPCVFNVTSYGAVGDGNTDDTAAFREAWKAACAVESGILLAPSGYIFTITSTIFSGPCKPGFVFQVDGVLMAPDGPDCWPKADSNKQWLVFYRVDGMTLTGRGTIEGNGQKWWELPCKPHRGPNGSTLPGPCDSPALIRFFLSSGLMINTLRIQNSPQFHMKFDGCEGVLIEKLSISSPALSPNTDGIHIENTKSVSIFDSDIANGDDCISIGPGCSNVLIDNVTCDHGHGISIGSLGVHNSQACVSNISVQNAFIKNSDNGVRIKTWQGGTGSVSTIAFENIEMENVKNCIIVDQYYCLTKACRNQTSAVYVTNVSYKNIKGTYDVRSPPIHFACSDTIACTNITMSEVELLPAEGELVDDPFCWNAYGTQETLTIPPITCLQDGEPETLFDTSTYGC